MAASDGTVRYSSTKMAASDRTPRCCSTKMAASDRTPRDGRPHPALAGRSPQGEPERASERADGASCGHAVFGRHFFHRHTVKNIRKTDCEGRHRTEDPGRVVSECPGGLEQDKPRPGPALGLEQDKPRPGPALGLEQDKPRPGPALGLEQDKPRPGPALGLEQDKPRPGPGAQPPSQLHGATLGYFRRVGDTLDQGFEDQGEKELFITNVLDEVRGQELKLCTDPSVSLVLERLLGQCGAPGLRRFLAGLRPHYAHLTCHRCGAHVVQTALAQAARLSAQLGDVEEEEEGGGSLEQLIEELSAGARQRFLAYARDTHGSFVLRTLLQVLGGALLGAERAKGNPRKKSPRAGKQDNRLGKVTDFAVPEGFLAELRELAKLLEANVKVFVTNPTASPVFQVALQVLRRKEPTVASELCAAVVGYLGSLGQPGQSSPLLVFLKDKTSSHLLENIIQVSDKKLFRRLYKLHFRGQLVPLALHQVANFTVQRLVEAAPSQKLFSKMFDELCPGLEAILAQGHMGIITELAAACVKHKEKQQEMLMRLYQAFHCCEPASRRVACAPLFISLLTYEVVYDLAEEDSTTEHQPSAERTLQAISYHGSLLAQRLLRFDQPAPLVLSLAAMPEDDCLRLACDQTGSHVFDVLLTSGTVSDKQRKKVIRKFTGRFVQLACDKHGSRVLDQIWNSVPIGMKQAIAEELAARERELRSDPIGHHIARNFALAHFVKRRRDWDEHQAAESKRRKVFAELLAD
uniref:nucleolar protein 9-like n=1 Tax=Pristiophorus japonicus TaxID=55135 RepID=UPI00398E3D70